MVVDGEGAPAQSSGSAPLNKDLNLKDCKESWQVESFKARWTDNSWLLVMSHRPLVSAPRQRPDIAVGVALAFQLTRSRGVEFTSIRCLRVIYVCRPSCLLVYKWEDYEKLTASLLGNTSQIDMRSSFFHL